jgi:hypothetical protein
MRERRVEKYRSYAIQRVVALLVDAKRYVTAQNDCEKALKTSKDDLSLIKIEGVVDQIDTFIDAGKPIKRKGVIRRRRLPNRGLVYNQFSIVDVSAFTLPNSMTFSPHSASYVQHWQLGCSVSVLYNPIKHKFSAFCY